MFKIMRNVTFSKAMGAYKLFTKHEKINLIAIEQIDIICTESKTKPINTGKNKGLMVDDSNYTFFIKYEVK